MVQRNVPSELGLQADHVKRENQPQHQNLKNRGGAADLKKKMKKSGSVKRPELDTARAANLRRHVKGKQPGKAPPSHATPRSRSRQSSTTTTPSYMKPTSSSDARKEQSQVSVRSPHTGSPVKLVTLASGKKATKTLARTSSLKTMRALTKNPSFKPARAPVRKCSPVVLCEDLVAGRATCSSTLKDRKFPACLTLSPGGTESEGTSAIKVCPYTYCSLSGHRHAPLPPMKCFLSRRRRMLKAHRSIKLGCLSPRKVQSIGNGPNFDEKLLMQDDSKEPTIGPQSAEDDTDFFIEILSKHMEEDAEYTGIDSSGDYSSISDGRNETEAEDEEERVPETLADAPIHHDVETVDQNRDANSTDLGTTYSLYKNQEVKVADDICSPTAQFYELDSDASYMDWERGYPPALYLDHDLECSPEIAIEEGNTECHIIHDAFIIKSDDKGGSFDESLADEVSLDSFDEESLNSDAFSRTSDREYTGSYDYLQSSNNMQCSAHAQVPDEESEPACDDKNQMSFGCDQTPGNGLPLDNQGTSYCIMAEEETSLDNLTGKSLQNEEAIALTGDRVPNRDVTLTSAGKGNCDTMTDNVISNQSYSDIACQLQTELSDDPQTSDTETQDNSAENFITSSRIEPAKEPDLEVALLRSSERECNMVDRVKAGNEGKPETEGSALVRDAAKCKKPIQDRGELGLFNPRAPSFLPLEPDPEAEKVDLRHQELDERKNTEEWMVDYALRQAVTKLGPARKRKVALLVEAFEKVMPITKCEIHLSHNPALDHARPIQVCR